MSDGQKPPTGKKPKRPTRGQFAKSEPFTVHKTEASGTKVVSAAPTKEQIKAVFMASRHVEWTPFAQAMGWDPVKSRADYPSSLWVQEKKQTLAIAQAETIAEMVWDHRGQWHKDVLSALKELPKANDHMLEILKHRMRELTDMILDDSKDKEKAKHNPSFEWKPRFTKVTNSELLSLSIALKTVTDSKHKALMIDQWSLKVAETFTDPEQFKKDDAAAQDNEWVLSVRGHEDVSTKDLERLMYMYYDQKPPHVLLEEAQARMQGTRGPDHAPVYPESNDTPEETEAAGLFEAGADPGIGGEE